MVVMMMMMLVIVMMITIKVLTMMTGEMMMMIVMMFYWLSLSRLSTATAYSIFMDGVEEFGWRHWFSGNKKLSS